MNRKERRAQQSQAPAAFSSMKRQDMEMLAQGVTLHKAGNINEAQTIYKTIVSQYPKNTTALYLLGRIHFDKGELDESLRLFDRAINVDPKNDYSLFFKGLIKLTLGDFAQGWKLFESRWKSIRNNQARGFVQPLWLGKEPLMGKTILIDAEQGMGDIIQMARYLPMLQAQGAKVVLEAPAALAGLLATLKGTFQIAIMATQGAAAYPAFDLHCPYFSLPLAFNTELDTIPANIPYLFADPLKQQTWQQRLGNKTKPRIGLVWSGSTGHENDYNRSITLKRLSPLLASNMEFHSLQKEIRPDNVAFLSQQNNIALHAEHLNDFTDTAALVMEMDLVISVDTSVAHLAGALGKPLWVLLPFAPDFRWLLERDDSPWYPTARLFRQSTLGDWENVIAKVTEELKLRF